MTRVAHFAVAGLITFSSLGIATAEPVVTTPAPTAALPTHLGKDNWQHGENLLPDEFLAAYKSGDFRHEIRRPEVEQIGDDPVFRKAVEANRGRYDLDDNNSIIAVETGEPPAYVLGWPFPEIDPGDPKAAAKIVWNYYYTMYYGGNGHYRADLLWISREGLNRQIHVDAYRRYFDGQHPKFRDAAPDDDLLMQMLAEVHSPADVAGIISLSWRYKQAAQRDSIWAYVPALRRVRRVTPANRSDGFLGSDMTQDDGPFFDGKVEDFEWRLVGAQDMYVLFDKLSFDQQSKLERLPSGGWRMLIPEGPRLGFELPEWQGAPWCPVQEVLIRRPNWIVEAVPKDKYYLYGKIVLRFDKDMFLGSYSSKYDWQGNLIGSYAAVRTNVVKAGDDELWGWAGGAVALAINWKLDRATTAGITAGGGVPADSRIPLSSNLFAVQRLHSMGR